MMPEIDEPNAGHAEPAHLLCPDLCSLWRVVDLARRRIRSVARPHGHSAGQSLGRNGCLVMDNNTKDACECGRLWAVATEPMLRGRPGALLVVVQLVAGRRRPAGLFLSFVHEKVVVILESDRLGVLTTVVILVVLALALGKGVVEHLAGARLSAAAAHELPPASAQETHLHVVPDGRVAASLVAPGKLLEQALPPSPAANDEEGGSGEGGEGDDRARAKDPGGTGCQRKDAVKEALVADVANVAEVGTTLGFGCIRFGAVHARRSGLRESGLVRLARCGRVVTRQMRRRLGVLLGAGRDVLGSRLLLVWLALFG